jgi:integrase
MKTSSVLKVYKSGTYEYVYIYYKLGSNLIRINTGNKYVKSKMTKELLYNVLMDDYKRLNNITLRLKTSVDLYIMKKLQFRRPSVNQKECLKYIEDGSFNSGEMPIKGLQESLIDNTHNANNPIAQPINRDQPNTLIDHYEVFYAFKVKELNNKPSVKDYLSLKNALLDYQEKFKVTLILKSINNLDFMLDFKQFLSEKHEGGLTRGELNDNTINKRFSCLKTFMDHLEIKKLFIYDREVMKFKLSKYDIDAIVLSKQDIKSLTDLKIENKYWQQIVDIFVFNCFCGMRISDLGKLKKSNFVIDDAGDYSIVLYTKKNDTSVQISVTPTSLAIAKKYDFKLPALTSQYVNREIKIILKHYDLFPEVINNKRRVLKENRDYETLRRDKISTHTCRRTFITLAVNNNVPLNSIMLASGHKKLETVKKYMKKEPNKEAFNKIDFEQPPKKKVGRKSLQKKEN